MHLSDNLNHSKRFPSKRRGGKGGLGPSSTFFAKLYMYNHDQRPFIIIIIFLLIKVFFYQSSPPPPPQFKFASDATASNIHYTYIYIYIYMRWECTNFHND